MDEKQNLLDVAALGHELELFWASSVGRYLQSRAAEVYSAAVDQLKSVDPEDAKAIRQAQNDILNAERFGEWINEGIAAGLSALRVLEGQEDSDG